MKGVGSAVGLAALVSALALAAPTSAATVTIGANVNDTSSTVAAGCVPPAP